MNNVIQFPRPSIRICRIRNGVTEYRTIPGTWNDCPAGWSVCCSRVAPRREQAA